jgi:hypothetical protein
MQTQRAQSEWLDDREDEQLQRALTQLNQRRFTPFVRAMPPSASELATELSDEMLLRVEEHEFLLAERARVAKAAAAAPKTGAAFLDWLREVQRTGPGQGHYLFPWLAQHATLDEMRWFIAQEVAGEAGFDDLVALTQVNLPTRAKLELARNYWDEMGRGHASGMHGPMLERLVASLRVDRSQPVVWESMALANLMCGLAANRELAYHSVGALGIIELTAPARAEHVNEGLKRLACEPRARQYFALHATLDVHHSAAWNREVIAPLIDDDPALATPIAEGALMRLHAGLRCFERYAAHFFPAGPTTH